MESFRNIPANRSVPRKETARAGKGLSRLRSTHAPQTAGRPITQEAGSAAPASTHHSAASTQRLG